MSVTPQMPGTEWRSRKRTGPAEGLGPPQEEAIFERME